MAAEMGMSQSAGSRIWRAFGLRPHLGEQFRHSPDPQFIDKVRDSLPRPRCGVASLYLNPPEAAVVRCADEQTRIQPLDRTAPTQPMLPGMPNRRTHGYVRHGAINRYAALGVASGYVNADLTPRHRAREVLRFLELIDQSVPDEFAVHVVLDNVSTHRTAEVQRWHQRHPRFQFHFTPSGRSWIRLVERWFAEPTTYWLRRSTRRSVAELSRAVEH